MSKTPTLLDVPKTAPSKRERIKAFKKLHSIETYYSKGCDDPWTAGHLPSCRKLGYGCTETSSLVECAVNVGRLMDEAGYATYAKTQVEAIRELCANVGIVCDL